MAAKPTLPTDSQWWEKCARHTQSQTSRNLVNIFLCDQCTGRLTREALNDRPPIFHGEPLPGGGYCGLCNEHKPVAMRQWFACVQCWSTVVSYQKSMAAAKAIRDFWDLRIAPIDPELELVELDEMRLEPYRRGAKTKRSLAEDLLSTDFVARRKEGRGEGEMLFHIEQKAGPGAIGGMPEFQLDVNDFNDIVGPVLNTGVIAYVFHVQVGMDYEPPTRRAVARAMWWTDIVTLGRHKLAEGPRPGENKPALFFDPNAFRTMDSFEMEVREARYLKRTGLLASSGIAFVDPSGIPRKKSRVARPGLGGLHLFD